ncbi:hypothetical protein [Paraburkholderia megapolitana]|nr:hypothetical protein [Paraburkholderia megapolitana]QDQ83771.1 hypothetical protein FNZ07_21695 [Paraburkholderia megapolitana]
MKLRVQRDFLKQNRCLFVSAIIATFALYGCGGGGGDSAPANTPSSTSPTQSPSSSTINDVRGIYTGTTGDGKTITGIILDNGTMHLVTTNKTDNSTHILTGGLRNADSANFVFDVSDFTIDHNDKQGLGEMSGSYVTKKAITGHLNYVPEGAHQPAPGAGIPFSLNYSSSSEETASLDQLPAAVGINIRGTSYSGSTDTANLSVNAPAFLMMDKNGNAELEGPGTCTGEGRISPRKKDNAYDMYFSYKKTPQCDLSELRASGILYFGKTDNNPKTLIMIGAEIDKAVNFLITGQ